MGKRSGLLTVVVAAVVAAAVVIVGVVVLGDDGTTSRQDYQAAVVNARDRVDFAYGRIARSQSLEEVIERLDEAAVVVGDTASDLDDKGAPEGLDDENERLVVALRAFSDVLAGSAAQFRDPAFAPSLEGLTSLSFPEWDRVNKVLAELDEKGIEVAQLARHGGSAP
jgi:hypothetical protein